MTALPFLPPVGRDREVRGGDRGLRDGVGSAAANGRPEERRQDPGRLDPITFLPNRRQFLPTRRSGATPAPTLVLITLADAAGLQRDPARARARPLRRLHPRRGGAARRDPRAGHRDLPRQPAELRLPAARPCRAGSAGDDRPRRRRRSASRSCATTCRSTPASASACKALGRVGGSPGEDLRAALSAAQDSRGARAGWSWFDRKSDEAHRRAFRLLSDLKYALERREPARAALPAEGDARHRAPASAPRRCCAGRIRSSARSRRASSSRSPRRRRSSRR